MMFFKTISDTLYRNRMFRISVFMPTDNSIYKDRKYEIVSVHGNDNNLRLSLNTCARLNIGFHVASRPDEEGNVKEDKIFIPTPIFASLSDAFTVCCTWLTSKGFDYLFKKDKDGNIYGLGEPPPYLPGVYKVNNEYLRFYPAVVNDMNGVKCEGVRIESHLGPFYQFTCTEFLNIAYIVQNFIANQYQITLQLLNLGVGILNTMKLK